MEEIAKSILCLSATRFYSSLSAGRQGKVRCGEVGCGAVGSGTVRRVLSRHGGRGAVGAVRYVRVGLGESG